MRLTKAELEEATGASDLHSLVELSLTNKYVDDLGYLGKLTQLQEVSLAFNDLRNLDDLAQCADLRELNVMHNKLRALTGLESMGKLDVLKASKNRLSDLSACVALHQASCSLPAPVLACCCIERYRVHMHMSAYVSQQARQRPLATRALGSEQLHQGPCRGDKRAEGVAEVAEAGFPAQPLLCRWRRRKDFPDVFAVAAPQP